jgi:hypothetical protein
MKSLRDLRFSRRRRCRCVIFSPFFPMLKSWVAAPRGLVGWRWRQYVPPKSWYLPTVRFQVLTTASIKLAVFWVVAPCSLIEVYRRFRGACCLHHQGDRPDDDETTQKINIKNKQIPLYNNEYYFTSAPLIRCNGGHRDYLTFYYTGTHTAVFFYCYRSEVSWLPGCWPLLTASECDLPIQGTEGYRKTVAGPRIEGVAFFCLLEILALACPFLLDTVKTFQSNNLKGWWMWVTSW